MSDLSAETLAILAGADPNAKKKSGLLPTIATVAGLTVVGLAGGAGLGYLLGKPAEAPAEPVAAAEPADATDAQGLPAQGDVVLPLEPILTDLAAPAGTQVRMEVSLLLHAKDVENQTLLASQVQADTITFVRSLELAQIEGARGLLHLKEDLTERARLRSPGVADVLVRSLVVK